MKKKWKFLVPLLLAVAILFSIGWYLLEYDPTFTRDTLLQQARRLENSGHLDAAVWFYRLAYFQSGNDDSVAIELAEQFKVIGNYSKAEYTLTKAIEDGGGVDLYIALCKTYVEQNKLRDAVRMLDQVSNPSIREALNKLRPAAPTVSAAPGSYTQYLTVALSAQDCKIYASLDREYPSVSDDLYGAPIALPGGETVISAVSVARNGLVSPLTTYTYHIDGVIEAVSFADPVIEFALRSQLQAGDDHVIYSDELLEVTALEIPANAASCADLKWLPNLRELTIRDSTLSDPEVFSSLRQLETLVITDSRLPGTALKEIAALPSLKSLTLSGCGISTIADLAGLNGLTYLDLSNNTIRNLSPLGAMQSLEELHLRGNALTGLADLVPLTGLRVLDVAYNSLSSTAPLAGLTGLTSLDVSGNGLMDLDGVGALENLTALSASDNNLVVVDSLKTCGELRTLDLSYNTLLNIDALASLKNLEKLDFSHNEVKTLPKFQAGCALVSIDGSYNLLSSLNPLSALQKLTTVTMDYNTGISNIDALRSCGALQRVDVYGCKVRDVSKLTQKGILVNFTPV